MAGILRRALFFLIPFSVVFWYVHEHFEDVIYRSSLSGLSGLYSTIGVIFGLVVAFVIQREWEAWEQLSESVRAEIDMIREMWESSNFAEEHLRDEAHRHIAKYLELVSTELSEGDWKNRSAEIDANLRQLRGLLSKMSLSMGSMGAQLYYAFRNLVKARNQRINLSREHMPSILKRVVVFATALVILLSLFLTVNNIYIDYIFTASIGLLVFSLSVVVDDLDNPFRPGTWHLTANGYKELAKELGIN